MSHVYQQGSLKIILNGEKGVFCEACLKNITDEHLITMQITENFAAVPRMHLCVDCAIDLIACLRKALGIALITEKECK